MTAPKPDEELKEAAGDLWRAVQDAARLSREPGFEHGPAGKLAKIRFWMAVKKLAEAIRNR